MRRAVVVVVSMLMVAVGRGARADQASSASRQSITFIQQISKDQLGEWFDAESDTELEPAIAVDPNNPDRIVAVVQESRFGSVGAFDNGYATSQDGGQTWTTAPFPRLTIATGGTWKRASDPSVAFGPDGAVYAASLVFSSVECPSGVAVQRSDDGGLTWRHPVLIKDDNNCNVFNDKDWIAVDTSPASPHFGRVYVVWDRPQLGFQPVVLKFSDDLGVTWSSLETITSNSVHGTSAFPLVHANGDLTVVFSDPFKAQVEAILSQDGGVTFTNPVVVSGYQGIEPSDMRTGVTIDSTSSSLDPVSDTIYTVWQDGRFRSDGFNDVVLTTSTDEGVTWSAVRRVNLDAPDSQIDHLTPAIAAFGNTVSVEYVFRDMSVGLNQIVSEHYLESTDGGANFFGDTKLGGDTDLTWAARSGDDWRAFLGDYMGMAASAGVAFAVWPHASQPRNLSKIYHQTLWSATIAP